MDHAKCFVICALLMSRYIILAGYNFGLVVSCFCSIFFRAFVASLSAFTFSISSHLVSFSFFYLGGHIRDLWSMCYIAFGVSSQSLIGCPYVV